MRSHLLGAVRGTIALGLTACASPPTTPASESPPTAVPAAPETPTPEPARRCDPTMLGPWEAGVPPVRLGREVVVPVRASPCDAQPSATCTLAAGEYHPTASPQRAEYGLIRGADVYRLERDVTWDDPRGQPRHLPAGTEIELRHQRDICEWWLGEEFFQRPECPPDPRFALVRASDFAPIHYVEVGCHDRYGTWVADVDDLRALSEEARAGAP